MPLVSAFVASTRPDHAAAARWCLCRASLCLLQAAQQIAEHREWCQSPFRQITRRLHRGDAFLRVGGDLTAGAAPQTTPLERSQDAPAETMLTDIVMLCGALRYKLLQTASARRLTVVRSLQLSKCRKYSMTPYRPCTAGLQAVAAENNQSIALSKTLLVYRM